MNRKSNLRLAVTWFVAGSLVGTYWPGTAFSHRVHALLRDTLKNYPTWMHLPVMVFLAVLAFQPAVNLFRRYRENWKAKERLFTPIEAGALFALGAVGMALLNGSIPHSRAGYSHATGLALIVWGLGAVGFLVLTVASSFFERRAVIAKVRSDDLMDVPISNDDEDVLGRVKFVDDLYAQVRNFPSEDSIVFGLNGAWGTGKTSVLNLLRNRLRADQNIILVDFNPWYFQSPEIITRRFYESVAHAINEKFFLPELNSMLRRYARILAPVLKRYGIEYQASDEASVEEVKALVEFYIARTGRRVVVVVDDLERAHRDELLTILQIVRLSASFRNTLFVLAFDHRQVSRQLKRASIAPNFLDKIVQYPIDLPAADKDEIDRFVIYSDFEGRKSHLDKILDRLQISGKRREDFDKNSVELYAAKLSPFFSNLRDAKRFLIGFSVRLAVVKDEVHLLDFFLLEILRIFAGSVYNDIWENRYFYLPSWTTKSLLSSPWGFEFDDTDKHQRRQEIRAHVEKLLADAKNKDNVLEILKKLFPVRIADAFDRPATYGDNVAARFRAEQRLTHPESFIKYFLLSVPTGVVSDASVETMLESWSRSESPESAILGDLASLRESQRLVENLDRIVIFLAKVKAELVKPLLMAVSRNIDSVSLGESRSEQDSQFKLILFLLYERVADAEKQSSMEAVLRRIRPIDVAVRIVNAIMGDQSEVTWGLRRSLDISKLQKLVQDRFRNEFVDERTDIFIANKLPLYVLYQIGTYGTEAAQMINAYTFELLEKKFEYIGTLIDGFLIEFPGGPNQFNFGQLKAVYDVKRLGELVRRAGKNAWTNEKQKRAIDMFLDNTKQESKGPNGDSNGVLQ